MKGDNRWLAVYGAAFALHIQNAREAGFGVTDRLIDEAIEEASAQADWELERRPKPPHVTISI